MIWLLLIALTGTALYSAVRMSRRKLLVRRAASEQLEWQRARTLEADRVRLEQHERFLCDLPNSYHLAKLDHDRQLHALMRLEGRLPNREALRLEYRTLYPRTDDDTDRMSLHDAPTRPGASA